MDKQGSGFLSSFSRWTNGIRTRASQRRNPSSVVPSSDSQQTPLTVGYRAQDSRQDSPEISRALPNEETREPVPSSTRQGAVYKLMTQEPPAKGNTSDSTPAADENTEREPDHTVENVEEQDSTILQNQVIRNRTSAGNPNLQSIWDAYQSGISGQQPATRTSGPSSST